LFIYQAKSLSAGIRRALSHGGAASLLSTWKHVLSGLNSVNALMRLHPGTAALACFMYIGHLLGSILHRKRAPCHAHTQLLGAPDMAGSDRHKLRHQSSLLGQAVFYEYGEVGYVVRHFVYEHCHSCRDPVACTSKSRGVIPLSALFAHMLFAVTESASDTRACLL
jgi:hypothetical protein